MNAPNPQTILNHAATMRTFNQNPDHNDLTKLLHEMAQTILHLHQRLETLETTPAQPTTTRTPLIYEEQ